MGVNMKNCILKSHLCLRERIFLSFFSKKPIYIENIRNNSKKPGLRKFELDLFSLIDKISHKSLIEVNEAGTNLKFTPGHLKNGNFFQPVRT